MVSLADQLRGIASADADRITAHHGAPSGKSYIFPAKDAAALDFNAIYNIAISGLDEILELDPLMSEFEEELFGESTKSLDRMMLSQEANHRLDLVLDRCIRRLGQWMGLKSGAKCFEWLVRRFRVHEMNVGAVIQAFLPYHESSQFPRILAILKLDTKSPYYNLLHPLQKTPQTLDRALLVRYMSPAKDSSLFVLQDVMNLLAQAEQEKAVHRALVNFWGAVMLDFVDRMRLEKNGIPEPVVKVLVEGFIRVLSCQHGGPDFAVSGLEIANRAEADTLKSAGHLPIFAAFRQICATRCRALYRAPACAVHQPRCGCRSQAHHTHDHSRTSAGRFRREQR